MLATNKIEQIMGFPYNFPQSRAIQTSVWQFTGRMRWYYLFIELHGSLFRLKHDGPVLSLVIIKGAIVTGPNLGKGEMLE